MKITFVTTVLNGEKQVTELLKSLSHQTLLPDEVIIVDGGSTDSTVEKIKKFNYLTKNKLNIEYFVMKGNIAVGRNNAITKSTGDIIVCSDVGCILEKNWLKFIAEPFSSNKVDVVAGFYKPIWHNIFEKSLSTYTCAMEDRVDVDNFLPSSRSIAFKKNVWKKLGGYPEWLNTCEDLVFARRAMESGFRFKTSLNAIAYWPQRKNFKQAFLQFFNYALGDGKARYIRFGTPFLYARYFLGFLILLCAIIYDNKNLILLLGLTFIIYLMWAISKNYKYVSHHKAIIYLPALQLVSDIAVLLGTSLGLIKSLFAKRG